MIDRADVSIIGYGPAGAAAVHELAKRGRHVAWIGMPPSQDRRKVGESLPGTARSLMTHMGLQSLLENGKHRQAFGNCSIWGGPGPVITDFIRDPRGLGWHLDRRAFETDFIDLVMQNPLVSRTEGKLEAGQFENELWHLQVGERRVTAPLVIDASGRSACFARTIGISLIQDGPLMAIYAWVPDTQGDALTWVEAVENGWWYSSRLPDQTRIVCFHTDLDEMPSPCHQEKFWRKQLAKTAFIQKVVDPKAKILEIHSGPAGGGQLQQVTGRQWLAAGDAALCFDPLSSQGIFNALYTGMKAAQAADRFLSEKSSQAFDDYRQSLSKIRQAYLVHLLHFYSSEDRWPRHRFWQSRRRAALDSIARFRHSFAES